MGGFSLFGPPPDPFNLRRFVCGPTQFDQGGVSQPMPWQRPPGCTFLSLYTVGGGGGGGGGKSAASGNARGGGGGGGSGAIVKIIMPLDDVPEVLYLIVPPGGLGGAADTDGSIGGIPIVLWGEPRAASDYSNYFMFGGTNQPSFGSKGTATAGGSGGGGGSVPLQQYMPASGAGFMQTIAGQTGANGGAHTGAVGGAITLPNTGITSMGGPGGAGVTAADFAGGTITLPTSSWLTSRAPAGPPAAGSNDGSHGYYIQQPPWGWCGYGGSSSNNGVGGNGGFGAIGCGGAGGGGGTTGGRGGDGGHGLIVLTCW